ncbi:MAG: iron ABC transporter substrate-binding protein, partial [Rectinema sp.]
MKRLIIAGLVLILSLTVAFGQQKLGVYTTLDEPLAKALFDEYQKETGIILNWQRLSGGEVEARL